MNEKQQGCFLIKGAWGVGKTYYIGNFKADGKKIKFVKISLFDKNDTSQIASEIKSKLISSGEKFLKKLLKIPTGVAGINFDLASLISEKNQLEKNEASKTHIVFIFDDLERTGMDVKDALGYINNINENYGFKVVVLANTDEITKEKESAFNNHREKIFYTEVLFSDNFSEIAKSIISKSKLESQERQIIESFSIAEHNNLRTLIFAIQKIEQVLEKSDNPLNEYVLISLIRTVVKYSIERANPPVEESEEENSIREMDLAMSKGQVSIYDMDFLEPFVNNDDYSFDEIIKNIKAIQQYAIENKDNPLPQLKEEWFYADDEEYYKIIEETKKWIGDNRIAISEYPNILTTIENGFFIKKMAMFCNADEYLDRIFEFMKANIHNADLDELNSLHFHIWPGRDDKGHIQQLKNEIDALREKKFEQAVGCDAFFDSSNLGIYSRLEELAIKGKDILEVCPPDMIVDRIKREDDLWAIDNARGVLLNFYRSYYPINTSQEERRKKLQENEKVKMLIKALNAYLEQEDMTKSKCFQIKTMIGNLDGTHF
jgi:hypothetical protein